MDTLAGLPEAVEQDFSESIVSRDDAMAVLAAAPGLGPPDLCWLQKGRGTWVPIADGITQGSHGYYHHVLGGDVGSSGAIAGYFAKLMARVERPGLLAGLWHGSELSLQRGFYCCYDAISHMDLRCELCVPGGVVCGLVDAAGNLHDAKDTQIWQQAQVSAFVRAQLYEPEMMLNGGCIVTADPIPTPAAEQQMLTAVESLYQKGILPGGLEPINMAQGFGAVAEHADLVLYAVLHHFRKRQRWEAARAFFAQLGTSYPAAAVWEAAAMRASGQSARVTELLASALHRAPSCAALLAAMASECLRLEQVDKAAQLARKAVHIQARCRPAWLVLASCYAAESQFAEALVTLNAVPTPPLPRDERELLLVVPPPEPERVTAPQVVTYQPDLEVARALALEEGDTGGTSRLLAYLPGAVLLNKEQADSGPWPDASPNRITRAILGAVYSQLQEIVGVLGWDGFLAVRSTVFVMHETVRSPTAASPRVTATATAKVPPTTSTVQASAVNGPQQVTPSPEIAGAAQIAPGRESASMAAGAGEHQQHHLPQQQQQQQGPSTSTTAAVPLAAMAGAGDSCSSRRSSAGGSKPDDAERAAFYANRLQAAMGAAASPSGQMRQAQAQSGTSSQAVSPRQTEQHVEEQQQQQQQQGGGEPGQQWQGQQWQDQQLQDQQQQERQEQQEQHQVQQPRKQEQRQEKQQPAQQERPASAPAPSTPGDTTYEPMAGRVLLLGRRTRRLGSEQDSQRVVSDQRPRSSLPSASHPSTSLAARPGVESLSRLSSASIVAALPTQPTQEPDPRGSNPLLWETVFGAGTQVRPLTPSDVMVTPPGGLPRIRTRPLGEGCEGTEHAGVTCSNSSGGSGSRRTLSGEENKGCRLPWCVAACVLGASATLLDRKRVSCGEGAPSGIQQPVGEGDEQPAAQGRQQPQPSQQPQQPQHQQGVPRAGSLLMRTRTCSTPGSAFVGSTRRSQLHGPLYSMGSGALSPSILPRYGSTSGVGPQLRSLEADREAIAAGRRLVQASADAGSGMSAGVGSSSHNGGRLGDTQLLRWQSSASDPPAEEPGVRLCVRWLDELVVALWHDLSAYLEWRCLDQSLRESRGMTHAELVITSHGRTSSSTTPSILTRGSDRAGATSSSDAAGPRPPALMAADWARRGFLAERLGHTHDARTAYRVAVTLAFNLTAYMALLRLEAQAGAVADALMSAQQLMLWHEAHAAAVLGAAAGGAGSSSASGRSGLLTRTPAPVQRFIGELAWGQGADHVQRALQEDSGGSAHPLLLKEVVEWRQQQDRDKEALAA